MTLADALFTFAAQALAAQQRLDAAYARDLEEFNALVARLPDGPVSALAASLAPRATLVSETVVEVQAASVDTQSTEIQIANTTYARRYRSREIQHTLTATVRRVPFLKEDHGKTR